MHVLVLAAALQVLPGAVNTGVLQSGDKAVLFDCCDTVTPERLAEHGIKKVDYVFCTQPRLPNVAGLYALAPLGAKAVCAPEARPLLESPETWWNSINNRYDLYRFQPVPEIPPRPLPVARTLSDGEEFDWESYRIRAATVPRAMQGALVYTVEADGTNCAFTGDIVAGPGKVYELHAFQADYVRYPLGNCQAAVNHLLSLNADVLIPSHGEIMKDPEPAIRATLDRIAAIPGVPGGGLPETDPPPFIKRVESTTHLVLSESGDALVVDCAGDEEIAEILQRQRDGEIGNPEVAYITHYHDDHCGGMGNLRMWFPNMEVIADERITDILRYPRRYRLPCVTHRPSPVTRPVKDGESWAWREFKLTSVFFPGQTLYHGALLLEGRGWKILFVGDAFNAGPSIVDYCMHNRNLQGEDNGYLRCFRLVRELKPDWLMCQHTPKPFGWSEELFLKMEEGFIERRARFADLVAWEHPDFGMDPSWVRTYPYEQDAGAGAVCRIDAVFMNHAAEPRQAEAEPMLPEGWSFRREDSTTRVTVPPGGEAAARLFVAIPKDAAGGVTVVPLRVTWQDRYLGAFRSAIINVMP